MASKNGKSMASNDLESIVYVSSAGKLLNFDDIENLLKPARLRNQEYGITGVLLYIGGNFMQYLEGPANSLDVIYRIIEEDDHHNGIIQISREAIEERQFSDWSMAFQTRNTEGFVGAPSDRKLIDMIMNAPAEEPNTAQIVLRGFWERSLSK